jgi:hypothetical protein
MYGIVPDPDSLPPAESLSQGGKKVRLIYIARASAVPPPSVFSAFGSLTVATPSLLLHSPSLQTGRELFDAHRSIDIFSIYLSKKSRFNSCSFEFKTTATPRRFTASTEADLLTYTYHRNHLVTVN